MENSRQEVQKEYAQMVLLADDDMFIRGLIKSIVKPYAQIETVADGSEVLECYKELRPAVVILDIHLPGRSGLKICSDILAYDPDAYIVLVSGDSTKENVMRAKAQGAKSFLTKPFHKSKLVNVIQRCSHLKKQYV